MKRKAVLLVAALAMTLLVGAEKGCVEKIEDAWKKACTIAQKYYDGAEGIYKDAVEKVESAGMRYDFECPGDPIDNLTEECVWLRDGLEFAKAFAVEAKSVLDKAGRVVRVTCPLPGVAPRILSESEMRVTLDELSDVEDWVKKHGGKP